MLDNVEYERWMKQAQHTLKSAYSDIGAGYYDWASFKAHQSAEYAVKAVLRALGKPAFGHALSTLIMELKPPEGLLNKVKRLDRHYLAPRYPNQWVEKAPIDYYTREDAEEAIGIAEEVMKWVVDCYRHLKKG